MKHKELQFKTVKPILRSTLEHLIVWKILLLHFFIINKWFAEGLINNSISH